MEAGAIETNGEESGRCVLSGPSRAHEGEACSVRREARFVVAHGGRRPSDPPELPAARAHDALLVVDVIQALGVIPIDVEAELVDVAAGACHKWLLTPEGVGLLYLSARARERIQPTLVGWTSVPNPDDYGNYAQGWNEGTLAWETGTGPVALVHGLEASLKLLNEVGISTIQAHLEKLTDHLCEQLRNTNYEVVSSRRKGEKSQIVCIRNTAGLSSMDLYSHLRKRNIITAPRGDRLRISPHFYNTLDEMDELVKALPQ